MNDFKNCKNKNTVKSQLCIFLKKRIFVFFAKFWHIDFKIMRYGKDFYERSIHTTVGKFYFSKEQGAVLLNNGLQGTLV